MFEIIYGVQAQCTGLTVTNSAMFIYYLQNPILSATSRQEMRQNFLSPQFNSSKIPSDLKTIVSTYERRGVTRIEISMQTIIDGQNAYAKCSTTLILSIINLGNSPWPLGPHYH